MIKKLCLLMLITCTASCNKQVRLSEEANEDEKRGLELLSQARQQLSEKDYASARQTVYQMREEQLVAKNARLQAILTLDSIELFDALQQGDSLKAEFYKHKLSVDKDSVEAKLR